MAAAPASSPVEFLLRRPPRRRLPLAGALFAPTGLSGAPLLRTLVSLAADLLASPRPPSQRRNLDAVTRRLALLSALLDSLLLALGDAEGEGEGAFSDAANLCFRELYVVLFRADLLVSYVASAGRAWALLRGHPLATIFDCWREKKKRNCWRWIFFLPIFIWGIGKYQILERNYNKLLEMLNMITSLCASLVP